MSASVAQRPPAVRSRGRVAVILVSAVVIAVAVNAVIATTVMAAGAAPADYGPLTFPAYALFTALGVVGGWLGWMVVRRRARQPRRALAILVPVVTVLSFVPDVALMVLRFIPGTTILGVVALMLMHLVVVAVAVPAYVLASRR